MEQSLLGAGDQLQRALADCNESLRQRANDANALDSRGLLHLKLADLDAAITDYEAALRLDPRRPGSLYGCGIAGLKKGCPRGHTLLPVAPDLAPALHPAVFSGKRKCAIIFKI